MESLSYKCRTCNHLFDDHEAWGLGDDDTCPVCGSTDLTRIGEEQDSLVGPDDLVLPEDQSETPTVRTVTEEL